MAVSVFPAPSLPAAVTATTGYHGNLVTLVPTLPSFPTAPPANIGRGAGSSAPESHLAQRSLWAAGPAGRGVGVAPTVPAGGDILPPTLGGWQWAGECVMLVFQGCDNET